MVRASRLFSDQELTQLREVISQAEKNTSGEIVLAVASDSGRYDRAEDVIGLLFGLCSFSLVWLFFQKSIPSSADWSSGSTIALGLLPLLLVIIVGFAVGAAVATYFPVIRLPFIMEREKKEEVERRCAECFYRYGVGRTVGATGVIVYVSLFERMVVVKGDKRISSRLSEEDWRGVCETIIQGFKKGTPCEGLCEGLAKCGDHLASHFPREAADTNELEDAVHLID